MRILKLKILAGFMLLVVLLIAAGAVSIVEFVKLSRSGRVLIDENYRTIEASKTMLEALEREDSGFLLVLLGEVDRGRETIRRADSTFMVAYTDAKNIITEVGEDAIIAKIDSLYGFYKGKLNQTVAPNLLHAGIEQPYMDTHGHFLNLKSVVNELMSLNQRSMYEEASILKDKSHRAIMPGIVAIVGGLMFSVILSFFIFKYFVSPLTCLAEAVKNYHPRDKSLKSSIQSHDEIKKLESEINGLIARLAKASELQK